MSIDPFAQSVSEFFERLSSEPQDILIVLTFIVILAAIVGDIRGQQESEREYKKWRDQNEKE